MKIVKKGVSFARLKTILARQKDSNFGCDYQPAIRAVREEAPSLSTASTIRSKRLGRELHLLSSNEQNAALIALYIPQLQDLHEQKMLPTDPALHPLYGFPGIVNVELPTFSGTVAVAERLGHLKIHPTVLATKPNEEGEKVRVPYPYIGDLLLFLQDEIGLYCVNWTIKQDELDFQRVGPNPSKRKQRNPEAARNDAFARHEIEAHLYSEVAIRTVQIAGNKFDLRVIDNLRFLHSYEASALIVQPELYEEMLVAFKVGMSVDRLPIETMTMLVLRHGCHINVCQTVLYRAIWCRQLRVDLFKPIMPDRPLKHESTDFLFTIADWYRR